MKVRDFMSRDYISVEEYNIVEDVVIIMQKYKQLNLPVVDFSGHLIGNINARDILSLVTTEHHSLFKFSLNPFDSAGNFIFEDLQRIKNQYIYHFINRDVKYVYEDDSILYAANILLDEKMLTIPVVNSDKKLIGILNSIEMLYKMLNYNE